MSLPTNNKKGGNKTGKNQPGMHSNSKFIKASSKPGGAKQKVRSTGANREVSRNRISSSYKLKFSKSKTVFNQGKNCFIFCLQKNQAI